MFKCSNSAHGAEYSQYNKFSDFSSALANATAALQSENTIEEVEKMKFMTNILL